MLLVSMKDEEPDKKLEDSPKVSTEQLTVTDVTSADSRRSRKTNKTRVMSEEQRSDRRREPASRRHVSMDEEDLANSPKRVPVSLPPAADKNTPAQSVCPWEDESVLFNIFFLFFKIVFSF